LGTGISFLYFLETNKYSIGEIWAPIHINIEVDKQFTHNITILLPQQEELYWLSPTTDYGNKTQNIVMHVKIPVSGFYRGIALRIPNDDFEQTLKAIDNISIFIGNKLFYFSSSNIAKMNGTQRDGYGIVRLPNIQYEPSVLIKNWTNYYGDLNFALKGIGAFFIYPMKFSLTWAFILCLFFLHRKRISAIYTEFTTKYKNTTTVILLIVIILAGFALRINGYVRHSGWSDEIYSATVAGNPTMPFLNTFSDPGNPPFYTTLLRFWFKLFGWSEESGRLLSVLIGTCAIPALYCFVKPFFGRKTALLAALFMAISTFAVGYSQEMRGYIVKICLAPLIAFCFFNFMKNQSLKMLLLYILLSMFIVNTHYYGILFIMANFFFFIIFNAVYKTFEVKKTVLFIAGNSIIALSFMPYFLYMLLFRNYPFTRDDMTMQPQHTLIMLAIIIFLAIFILLRKKLSEKKLFNNDLNQNTFAAYLVFIPVAIYTLAYLLSFITPMIKDRYIWPINLPFFLALAAVVISLCRSHKKLKAFSLLLVWSTIIALYEATPGGDFAYYRESRAYIAGDAAAHPENNSAMLDNAPQNAHYYGYSDIPVYTPEEKIDVLYIFNNMFMMQESNMYDVLGYYGLDDTNMLKIRVNDELVVFKKSWVSKL
jgi:hypothetical protein